jgi:exopolysaccharide biosynthesis polyprenyl glycosylphosphotransferase
MPELALRARINRAARTLPPAHQWKLFFFALVVNDVITMYLGFRLAYFIRFNISIPFFYQEIPPSQDLYSNLMLLLTPLWFLIFLAVGLYNRQYLLGGTEEYSRVFRATTFGLLSVIVAGFLQPEFIIARGWLLLAWGMAFLLTSWGRFLIRRLIYHLRQDGYFLSPAVIVGANAEGRSLAEQLRSWKTSGLYILGFIDNKTEVTVPYQQALPILGEIDKLDKIIEQHKVEELIIATSALSREEMLSIFKEYGVNSRVNLRMSSGLYEIITTGLQVKELAFVPLVGVNKVRLTGADKVLKFILDYGIAIPALLLISPVLLMIAIAVKLDSPGPIVHRRRVMGVNGRQFDAFKFRTMYMNGDEILNRYPDLEKELEENHKLKDDPRVTRIGHFLRKYSLDELLQMFNVLRREMSLVGPRMISPVEMKNYNHWGINLLTVQPGITGLWQVSGRSDVSYEQRIRLDMQYIRNWSIWLDLQIISRTLPAMIKADGAY